jgi:hypothetical protein
VTEGTSVDYFLHAADPDPDTLTFSLNTGLPGYGTAYTFVAPNKIVFTPPNGSAPNSWSIDAYVTDTSSNVATATFVLNSIAVPVTNQAPSFSPVPTD